MKHRFQYLQVLILVSLLIFTPLPSVAINSGEIYPHLSTMESNLTINLNFWNFENVDELSNSLLTKLPTQLVHESYYPSSNTIDQWQAYTYDHFQGLLHYFDYQVIQRSSQEFTSVLDNLETGISNYTNVLSPLNSSVSYNGTAIHSSMVVDAFEEFSPSTAYSIHIVNFTSFDNLQNDNSYHWFQTGITKSIKSIEQDMRSIVSHKRSVIIDLTAIAPYFGVEEPIAPHLYNSYLKTVLIEILEKYVAGTPNTYNFLAMEKYIHLAKILIADNITDDYFSSTRYYGTPLDSMERELKELFPEFKENTGIEGIVISEDRDNNIRQLLDAYSTSINGETVVVVNSEFAEKFKDYIRIEQYLQTPEEYFYAQVVSLSNNRNFVYKTSADTYLPYTVNEFGLSILEADHWYDMPIKDLTVEFVTAENLRLLGITFGFPNLNNSVTSQIDSPMSSYGVSDEWEFNYTRIEKDAFLRRYGLMYRDGVLDVINEQISKIQDSIYFWNRWIINSLQSVKSIINQGDIQFVGLNYSNAMEIYLQAETEMIRSLEKVRNMVNFVNNGIWLAIFIIIIGYYIKVLREITISRDDFIKKIRKYRKSLYNRSKK